MAARSDLGSAGRHQHQHHQQQQNTPYQQSLTAEQLSQNHPLQANLFSGDGFTRSQPGSCNISSGKEGSFGFQNSSTPFHLFCYISPCIFFLSFSSPPGLMPTIADANQLLSDINPSSSFFSSSSSPTPNNLHSNQLAAAELPITSSGVRIASPTSRPSKHPPPTVPKHLHLRQNQSLIENPNQSSQNNHTQQSQSQSSSILLPTRAQPQVQVFSRRGVASRSGSSSFWQSLFSSCIAVETERTIACTDRVIYRPTADDEDQQVVTPPPPPPPQPPNSSIGGGSGGNRRNNRLNRRRRSSSSQTIMACCSGRNGNGGPYQKCLKRLALAILLLLLAAVLLEVVHVLTNTCKYSFIGRV